MVIGLFLRQPCFINYQPLIFFLKMKEQASIKLIVPVPLVFVEI